MVDEALAPFDVLAMKTERDGYLVSKRLPDIEPLLVNRFVVRPALPEEGVHLVTMLLCAQVRQAVRSIRKRKGEQSTQSSALRPVLQRRKTRTKRSASLRMDLRIHSAPARIGAGTAGHYSDFPFRAWSKIVMRIE